MVISINLPCSFPSRMPFSSDWLHYLMTIKKQKKKNKKKKQKNRVFLSRNYQLTVAPRKFETSRANMRVLRT